MKKMSHGNTEMFTNRQDGKTRGNEPTHDSDGMNSLNSLGGEGGDHKLVFLGDVCFFFMPCLNHKTQRRKPYIATICTEGL